MDCGNCSAAKQPHRKERFGSDNCILCDKPGKIVKTSNGQAKILDAAIACEDSNIQYQIKSLDNVDDLSYHMDKKWFKSYILKKKIKRIVRETRIRFITLYPFCPCP